MEIICHPNLDDKRLVVELLVGLVVGGVGPTASADASASASIRASAPSPSPTP